MASYGPSAHQLAWLAAAAEFRHQLDTLTPDLADLDVWASGLTEHPVPPGTAELAAGYFRLLADRARADAKTALNNPQGA